MKHLLSKITFENSFSNYLSVDYMPGTDYTVVNKAKTVPAFIEHRAYRETHISKRK